MAHVMIPIIPIDPGIILVHQFLERSARLFPDKVAVVHGKVRATYREINERADSLAAWLNSRGVRKGDRVALLMENCAEYVVSYYGIMKAGATAVPLNGDLKPEGLRYAIEDLGSTVLVSNNRFRKVIDAADLGGLGLTDLILKGPAGDNSSVFTITTFDETVTARASGKPLLNIEEGDLASIIYTSGSTGGPKGVMLSHRNIVDNVSSICQYLHLTEEDIQMCVLPFFYVMGKSLLNTHIAVGGTVVINNQFAFPAAVLKEMIAEKVTGFSGVPSTFAYLLHRSPLAASAGKLTSLRYVSQAGGHMSRAIKEELRRVLPAHTEIIIMYGATEAAARLSYLEPSRLSDKIESIGIGIPGVELKVVNENGLETQIGEVGELVASGSNIMSGYWKKPEATAKALAGGWYHTGDRCYEDDEGFFFLVGRQDDLLKVGGHRLSTQEIEDVLMESKLFVEAAVVGLPDELLGNRLAVLGVPANDRCSEDEVLGFCANKLARYKMPHEVKFTRTLPKKASGKIDRQACKAAFSGFGNAF